MRVSETSDRSRGQILLLASVFLALILFLSAALVQYFANTVTVTTKQAKEERSLALAEAGIDRAIWCLNNGTACGASYVGETTALGPGEYVVTITSLLGNAKQIDAIGYIPSRANPTAKRHVRMTTVIDSTQISFNYGVQVGEGGLTMDNNATVNGNLYSDGSVDGSPGATINGSVNVATGMTLDQSYEVQNADLTFAQSSPIVDVAFSFTPSATNTLSQISVFLKKNGNPADLPVLLVSDSGGKPSKTVLASATLSSSSVGSGYSWINAAFPSPVSVTQGTTYWIILDGSANNGKYWIWGMDSGSGNATSATKSSSDWNAASPTWSNVSGDVDVRIWLGGIPTKIEETRVTGTGAEARANTIENSNITAATFCKSMLSTTVIGNVQCGNISGSTITGNVTAENVTGSTITGNLTCETQSGNTVSGSINCPTPVTPPNDPAVIPLPISSGNIADWEQDALVGGTINPPGGTLTINSSQDLGPVKINGNLIVSGSATVVSLTGPVWVAGDVTFDNNSTVMLDPGFGAYSTVIIADDPSSQSTKGIVKVQNNANLCGTDCDVNNGTYTLALSTYNGVSDAITVANNTHAGIFYASQGRARIKNNVQLKEVTAYSLYLENNATVNYETGLATAAFTSGPGASWIGKRGTWTVIDD